MVEGGREDHQSPEEDVNASEHFDSRADVLQLKPDLMISGGGFESLLFRKKRFLLHLIQYHVSI